MPPGFPDGFGLCFRVSPDTGVAPWMVSRASSPLVASRRLMTSGSYVTERQATRRFQGVLFGSFLCRPDSQIVLDRNGATRASSARRRQILTSSVAGDTISDPRVANSKDANVGGRHLNGNTPLSYSWDFVRDAQRPSTQREARRSSTSRFQTTEQPARPMYGGRAS
jgi:hypothetical protein